jgi:hypothetical protein
MRCSVRALGLALVTAGALAGAPAAGAAVDPLSLVSGPSPFGPGCTGVPETGTLYPNAEVEPYVAANPAHRRNLVGVWQQDRYSDGGANGLLTGESRDGGQTWTRPAPPPFTTCAGGNARNGGAYDRASDPWVTISPNGDAYQIALALADNQTTSAILVSKSRDRGTTWGPITTVRRDSDPTGAIVNDKESITADPTTSRYVYAIWDRLDILGDPTNPSSDYLGPTWFSRTTNGGASWETAHPIFDPGLNNQTIGNQVVVLPDGTLLDVFNLIFNGNTNNFTSNVALLRSTNHGKTWSKKPTIVDQEGSIGVVDPTTGNSVRTGDIIPEVAVDPRPGHDNVYLVWQDARFSGGQADQVAFSRSTDGGKTWSVAKRISEPGNVQAFTPMVRVDRRGNVGVTYYDFTSDTRSAPLDTDYWFVRSTNRGRTFGPRERITPTSFDMTTAPVAGGYFMGDYEGLTSVRQQFKPLAVFANSGDLANRTDVFATTVHAPFAAAATAAPTAAAKAGTRAGRSAAPGRLRSKGRFTSH